MSSITGQCLCGSVKYTAEELVSNMSNCHCSMCRKFHGAAFATYAQAKREHFKWTEGENHIKCFEAENGTVRKFCGQCGSSLIFQDKAEDTSAILHFAAGTIDSDVKESPDRHIYLESKANWLILNDDLNKYLKGSNGKKL